MAVKIGSGWSSCVPWCGWLQMQPGGLSSMAWQEDYFQSGSLISVCLLVNIADISQLCLVMQPQLIHILFSSQAKFKWNKFLILLVRLCTLSLLYSQNNSFKPRKKLKSWNSRKPIYIYSGAKPPLNSEFNFFFLITCTFIPTVQ